jgi:hypothetical protein
VQHLRDFGRFEMNKRDLDLSTRRSHLVAEEEILYEIENQPRTSTSLVSVKKYNVKKKS